MVPTELAAARFVLLGTYRRNGELLSAPVWMAAEGDHLVVTTEAATGKVRRLARDGRVVLTPCGRFGRPAPGAPVLHGRGRVSGSHDDDPSAVRALRDKYGPQFTAVLAVERLVRRLQRRRGDRVVLRLSMADAPDPTPRA